MISKTSEQRPKIRNKYYGVHLDPEYAEYLDQEAKRLHRSRSGMVEYILDHWRRQQENSNEEREVELSEL